ncbi:uncharacterized protein PV09_01743 [Verruconis gallopava]|uniref:Amidohydrolase-related domain-containing protein n=1 Tax=Verruconis gallopava TaxID=253628 RepID=A0A0D2AMT2_9PEZI|nr:uncharacterized protein PV09_01743 [Verruconis gallopava]KIW07825.1 hypothetical protein PV09_01743 [Verruconis gallopava]
MAFEFLKKHGFNLADEVDKIKFGEVETNRGEESIEEDSRFHELKKIVGVRLPCRPYLWDLQLDKGAVSAILPHEFNSPPQKNSPDILEARGCLIAPSLCHAHIHLDKCFLLQDPKFSDLQIVDGDFKEAMNLTTKAKQRFTRSDLLRRGRQLIIESIRAGVTAMRAFCEVDGDVGMKCLDTGLELKREFESKCDIQLCAFAQNPLFGGKDNGEKVRQLIMEAAKKAEVDVLGSTPYVEENEELELRNLEWMIDLTLQHSKMLDLHLDYHLDPQKKPLFWDVISLLKQKGWAKKGNRHVTLGHCTRLTHFTSSEWQKVKADCHDIPISFVGLPTSDLFMMKTEQQWRGTLHVPDMIQKHGLEAAIGTNNVGNAFTPQGNCDPLSLACLGVGLYSAGSQTDTDLLYDCVSCHARRAIGLRPGNRDFQVGDDADFVIFKKGYTKLRTRKSIAEVVYDPPAARITIKAGVIVSM